jgi:protein-L-isoaspartate O-methyltransferase
MNTNDSCAPRNTESTPATAAPSAAQLAEQLRTDGRLLAGQRAELAQQVIAAVRRENGGA